jgi:hypothetical protein
VNISVNPDRYFTIPTLPTVSKPPLSYGIWIILIFENYWYTIFSCLFFRKSIDSITQVHFHQCISIMPIITLFVFSTSSGNIRCYSVGKCVFIDKESRVSNKLVPQIRMIVMFMFMFTSGHDFEHVVVNMNGRVIYHHLELVKCYLLICLEWPVLGVEEVRTSWWRSTCPWFFLIFNFRTQFWTCYCEYEY